MKNSILSLAVLITLSCCSPSPSNTIYYLEDITIIDVSNGRTLRGMTVVITDSLISDLGETREIDIPHSAIVVNCHGRFLIPGLWDMHVHLGNATSDALPLYIANGVTGVRDMGTRSFDSIVSWRMQISSCTLKGPRIYSSGPILNGGHPDQDFQIGVNTPGEAIRVVDSLADIGVDFIKVHSALSREVYNAIAKETHKRGIPFVGHIPISNNNVAVTGEEASEAGQRSLEHMLGIPFARDTIKAYQNMYPSRASLDRLFSVLRKNGTYVTPTLSVYQIPADYEAISVKQDSLYKYISPELKYFWAGQTGDWPERNKAFMQWLLKARANMVPELWNAGILMLAGTDTGFPYVLPGFGLHRELRYLVKAGLSPMDALKTATINPATFLESGDRLGSVQKGKLADLVILNASPVSDIKNLTEIEAVIFNGKLLDRSALDGELKKVIRKVQTR